MNFAESIFEDVIALIKTDRNIVKPVENPTTIGRKVLKIMKSFINITKNIAITYK